MALRHYIRVTNLSSGMQLTYVDTTPREAVVYAHNQANGNFDPTTYDFTLAQTTKTGRVWTCGDWATIVRPSQGGGVER